MKENLQVLLKSLQDEKLQLEREKEKLAVQGVTLNRSRKATAFNCLVGLLPDLEMDTISALLRDVPDFHVPTVSGWFGLVKKVDPSVSLDTLRVKLGVHLDNARGAVPKIWKEVTLIDASIRDLQENLITSNAERRADIDMRIMALEKFLHIDVAKMDPRIRTQLEQAVSSQAGNAHKSSKSYSSFRDVAPVNIPYPSRTQIDSSSGSGLLEIWLWWQILSPHSECSHEIHRIESAGVDTRDSGEVHPLEVQSDAVSRTEESQLATQEELGSQSFS